MSLPQFNDNNQPFQLMQSQWASQLNPLLANPSLQTSILSDIPLVIGANVINHKLGRKLQGWRIVDINGVSTLYRSAPKNALTLTLTSSAAVVVSIEVF